MANPGTTMPIENNFELYYTFIPALFLQSEPSSRGFDMTISANILNEHEDFRQIPRPLFSGD